MKHRARVLPPIRGDFSFASLFEPKESEGRVQNEPDPLTSESHGLSQA